MEVICFRHIVERERVVADAWHAEVVGDAADRQDCDVERQPTLRYDDAVLSVYRRHIDLPALAIEPFEGALAEGKTMPARQSQIVHLVGAWIQAARGDLVQQRLPDVRLLLVYERHIEPIAAPELG